MRFWKTDMLDLIISVSSKILILALYLSSDLVKLLELTQETNKKK